MKHLLGWVGALALALISPCLASAQTVVLPQVKNAGGANVPSQATVITGSDGVEKGTAGNPLIITSGAPGTGTRTIAAGSSDTQAVPVQGVTGGVPQNVTAVPTASAAVAVTPMASASSLATGLVLKTAPGNYYDGYCRATVTGNCILYNSTSVPAAGALTPALVLECVAVPASGNGSWAYNTIPRRATVGMVMLFSSSADCNTYTASASAYLHASVM